MPRRSKPELGSSWGTVEDEPYEDDSGSGGENADDELPAMNKAPPVVSRMVDSEEEDLHTPLRRTPLRRSSRQSTPQPHASPQAVARAMRNLARKKESEEIPSPQSASGKRITRSQPRQQSGEPEFIMPSMHPDPAEGSWIQTTPRRRKVVSSSVQSSPRSATNGSAYSRSPRQPLPPRDDGEQNEPQLLPHLLWQYILYPVATYCVQILAHVFAYLKPLIALLVAILFAWSAIQWIFPQLLAPFSTLSAVPFVFRHLPSPCNIPGASFIPGCKNPSNSTTTPEFDQLMHVQSAFEDVLSSQQEGQALPADMKRSEASIRDLRTIVEYSHLPSRNELVFELGGFVRDAQQTSEDLIFFNSRIGRAIDRVVSTNRWTMQRISDASEREASRGSIFHLLDSLNPFYTPATIEEDLLEQYLKHTRIVEDEIAELIMKAQALLRLLKSLDDRLDVIASIVQRDGVALSDNRDELLAYLWTKLGGNRASVKKLNAQLALLRQVGVYRKTAWSHVAATLLKLQSIAAGLESLRESVSAPELVRTDVPLQQHVENIRLQAERLESVRSDSRRLEGEGIRKVLNKGKDGVVEERLIEGKTVSIRL